MMQARLYDAFNPKDKTNFAPYRLVHFVVLAFFINRFLAAGLAWPRMANMPAAHHVRPAVAVLSSRSAPTSCSSKSPTQSGSRSQSVSSASPC